ncbi:unnamed protein product [Diamesa tonsa]
MTTLDVVNSDKRVELVSTHVEDSEKSHKTSIRINLKGDYGNIGILLFLYLLQGVPLGIIIAVPMLLQNRGVSYKDQASVSFSMWPFALKLLWAPLVDSLYIKRFGRRKSWLIPTQLLIGVFMLILSSFIDGLMGDGVDKKPQILPLAIILFVLCFLEATQDIAVDGWALTMLKRCNIGHAATCNSVGQMTGFFIGFSVFVTLEAKGIVSFSQFLFIWGVIYVVATIIVAIFKKEQTHSDLEHQEDEPKYGIIQSYLILKKILSMKPIILLSVIFLTFPIMFAASNAITTLKLIDHGVPREKLALFIVFLFPFELLLPFVISKYTTGPQPLDVFIKLIPPSMLLTMITAGFVWFTPSLLNGQLNDIPLYYYAIYVLIQGLYHLFRQANNVAAMAFFARISDPRFGGTYMTLLNTINNFGSKWASTLMLWLVDYLTWKTCSIDSSNEVQQFSNFNSSTNNTCANKEDVEVCKQIGGECRMDIDGYYIECTFCFIYGILWFFWGKSKFNIIQNIPLQSWQVNYKIKQSENLS